jgi:AcrR family transcriptional regulator
VRAIVEAAARVLVEHGYDGTNVNRVAELAGVSVGSLYQYFPSKEALVAEVARDLAARTTGQFQDGLAELAFLPLRDAVHGVVERAVRALRINPALREMILRQMPLDVFDTRDFDGMLHDALRAYFEVGIVRVRPKNLELALTILRASVEGVAKATSIQQHDEGEVVSELTHLIYGYLRTDAPG